MLWLVASGAGAADAGEALMDAKGVDSCELCTPEERELRSIAQSKALAEALRTLMAEVEALAKQPEAVEVLLSDANTEAPNRIKRAVRAIQSKKQKPVKQSKPATPAKRPAAKAKTKKPSGPQGVEGLVPGFAEAENKALGIRANAVVVSHGRPIPLFIGQSLTHNNQRFELKRVAVREDADGVVWHDIVLVAGARSYTLEWR